MLIFGKGMAFEYDKTDRLSIYEYSKKLLGKTLEEAIAPRNIVSRDGKGRLGQLVEEYFFGYDVNSNPDADFSEAGLELKVTPLKELKNKTLAIKERLVCTMIDYDVDSSKSFEESHIYLKCACMLIMFYLHRANIPVQQLKFIYSVLWQIPSKDLLIMKQDYNKIVTKIRNGKAHELSEGDTQYLGACRKGQKGDKDVYYTLPDGSKSEFPAPKRAFSLKTQYMRTILEYAEAAAKGKSFDTSILFENTHEHLITESELANNSFEDILLDRFKPYYGKTYDEMVSALPLPETSAKSRFFLLANEILTEKHTRGLDVTKSEEFQKAGIIIKTVRVKYNGRPAEAMSFENINYFDILKEEDWYESRLYEIFTSRFLFVVYQEDESGEYRLDKAFFWTMPVDDLKAASVFWRKTREAIKENHISPEYFYRESQGLKFHIRPKAKNAADLAVNPNGGKAKKYCYWFNHDYVKSIVEEG